MARPNRTRASSISLSLTIAMGIKPRRGLKIEDRLTRDDAISNSGPSILDLQSSILNLQSSILDIPGRRRSVRERAGDRSRLVKRQVADLRAPAGVSLPRRVDDQRRQSQ